MSRKHYSEEFKQDAVDYQSTSGKSTTAASRDLGIAESTLRGWIQSASDNDGVVNHRGSGNYASDEAKEIAQLKRELQNHKDALEILKKAISILND